MKYWRELLLVVALVVIGFCGKLWLNDHDAKIRDEAKIEMYEQQRQEVKQDTEQKVEAKHQERQDAKTPEQEAQYIATNVGIEPPQIIAQPSGLNLLQFPATAAPKLADYVEKCEIAKVERDGCYKSLALADKEVLELKKVQGKTFWHKLSECGARGLIGGGGVAIGQFGSGSHDHLGRNAAIGFGAGAATCLFWKP